MEIKRFYQNYTLYKKALYVDLLVSIHDGPVLKPQTTLKLLKASLNQQLGICLIQSLLLLVPSI